MKQTCLGKRGGGSSVMYFTHIKFLPKVIGGVIGLIG
jgi:hypothetical protein